jgi:hypothetical protein
MGVCQHMLRRSPGSSGEGSPTVSARLIGLGRISAAAVCGLAALAALGGDARAQGKLEARYVVTLSGLVIGTGNWVIEIGEGKYTAAASGKTSGLLRVFADGEGTSASRGTVSHGNLIPASYSSSITTDKKAEDLRITLAGGNIKDYAIEPPPPPQPDRIPVTEAHRHGVMDPMSGALNRVAGTSEMLGPAACNHKASIFDGRMRYDLKLAYKRMETVKAAKGYEGRAVVCALYFVPIAGYVPRRKAIKYLVAQREMEAWLVPIAGTRVMVPFRVSVPTPIGMGVLEATEFVTTAKPSRAAANLKTQ